MGKTRGHFKKIRDTKGTFHAKMDTIKDRNGMDLTEAEYIRSRRGDKNTEFSSIQSLSPVQLCNHKDCSQAFWSITTSQSLLNLVSVMPSNHVILCCPLLLLPSIFPTIRVFSSSSHQVAKVLTLQLQHQSFQWIFRTYFL